MKEARKKKKLCPSRLPLILVVLFAFLGGLTPSPARALSESDVLTQIRQIPELRNIQITAVTAAGKGFTARVGKKNISAAWLMFWGTSLSAAPC